MKSAQPAADRTTTVRPNPTGSSIEANAETPPFDPPGQSAEAALPRDVTMAAAERAFDDAFNALFPELLTLVQRNLRRAPGEERDDVAITTLLQWQEQVRQRWRLRPAAPQTVLSENRGLLVKMARLDALDSLKSHLRRPAVEPLDELIGGGNSEGTTRGAQVRDERATVEANVLVAETMRTFLQRVRDDLGEEAAQQVLLRYEGLSDWEIVWVLCRTDLTTVLRGCPKLQNRVAFLIAWDWEEAYDHARGCRPCQICGEFLRRHTNLNMRFQRRKPKIAQIGHLFLTPSGEPVK